MNRRDGLSASISTVPMILNIGECNVEAKRDRIGSFRTYEFDNFARQPCAWHPTYHMMCINKCIWWPLLLKSLLRKPILFLASIFFTGSLSLSSSSMPSENSTIVFSRSKSWSRRMPSWEIGAQCFCFLMFSSNSTFFLQLSGLYSIEGGFVEYGLQETRGGG